nr:MAG TPA: hypothetical protein [Caudoviricetes sp.]
MPFKAQTWRLGVPYRVGARYLYPQAILIDSRRPPGARYTINHLDTDHQPLSCLAKPQLCGQCGILWGKKDTVKERGGASVFTP